MIRRFHQGNGISSEALYSPCDTYRYGLTRVWAADAPRLLYILLNPSTATEEQNDPTIARCEKRAQLLGYGSFRVVNLFAFRATDPADLKRAEIPLGPDNLEFLQQSALGWNPDLILCGWGAHGTYLNQSSIVLQNLRAWSVPLWHLGLTKMGEPRHPLYLSYRTQPQRWI